jgi:hypothetical protein
MITRYEHQFHHVIAKQKLTILGYMTVKPNLFILLKIA